MIGERKVFIDKQGHLKYMTRKRRQKRADEIEAERGDSSDEHKDAPPMARGLTARGGAGDGGGPSVRHVHDFGDSDGDAIFFDDSVSEWTIETFIETE
jgi:hypothetical protein